MNLWLDGQAHYDVSDLVPGKYNVKDDQNATWSIDPTGGPIGEPCIKRVSPNNFTNWGLTRAAQRTQGGTWAGGAGGAWGMKVKVDQLSSVGSSIGGPAAGQLSNSIFRVTNGNWDMVALGLNVDGSLALHLSGYGKIANTAGGIASAIWSALEFEWLFHLTTGYFRVHHNRTVILNYQGALHPNTYPFQDVTNAWTSISVLGCGGGVTSGGAPPLTMRMCHCYLNDLAGARNNGIMGPIRVLTIKPNGPGPVTEHAPSTPQPNWGLVADPIPDNDGGYVIATGVNSKDLYAHEDLPAGAVPLAVQSYQKVRAVTAGTPAVATAIQMGGAVVVSPALGLSGLVYGYQLQPFDTDPGTPGVPFTAANINAGFAGPVKAA